MRQIIFILFTMFLTNGFSQNLLPNGDVISEEDSLLVEKDVAINKSIEISSIPCDKNYFWGVYNGNIEQFNIVNGIVISMGVVDSNCPGHSLAISNNLDGGLISPTFYSTLSSLVYYYNSNNWIQTSQFSPFSGLPNAGGNGDYLFFLQNGFSSYNIIKYDGNNFYMFYSDSTLFSSVADLAIDNDGNIWHFTSSISQTTCQYLDVISPIGILIKRYNIDLETQNAYGSFILNDTLYVGLGEFNTVYPNTLLPIIIYSDTVMIGTPLSMPNVSFDDLASCNVGSPLSINNNPEFFNINIYPNPAKDQFSISSNNEDISNICITDITGKEVFTTTGKENVDISFLCHGTYFVTVSTLNSNYTKKLVVVR